ncbi:unnamed protein product [Penicillium salamii]|nr:unnamed protein product [Penicillium salamii]CAG8315565.1 unnamed protein product [Penicillium salamii]
MPKRRLETSHSNQNNEYLRLRSYRACGECRRRKRKCDGELPCSACAGHGYLCDYELARGNTQVCRGSDRDLPLPVPGVINDHGSRTSNDGVVAHQDLRNLTTPHLPATTEISPALVVSSTKDRVANSHSAAALPMILGRNLNDPDPPRIHSFAWNLGIGTERRISHTSKIHSYISKEESLIFAEVYFQSLILSDPSFESVLCGVVALGSFFSSLSHAHESQIFSQCVSILDLANVEPLTPLNKDILAGWILRTIYLRLTTRPHMACHASNTAVHTTEMLCLHRDIPTETKVCPTNFPESTTAQNHDHGRLFWVAWSLNVILSIESGLNPIHLPRITCRPISDEPHSHSGKLVRLAYILYDAYFKDDTELNWQQMHTLINQIQDIGAVSALISVFQADICLCLLRKAIQISTNIGPSLANVVVKIIETAFEKIHSLVEHRLPWWNVATVPFQTVCICLSINSLPILSLLPGATQLMQLEAKVFDSHLTNEALSTAQHLIKASQTHESSKESYRTLVLRMNEAERPSVHPDSPFQSSDNIFEDWPIFF